MKRAHPPKRGPGPTLAEPVEQAALPSGTGKLVPAAIALAGILVYLNSLYAPFLYDDRYHIVENARIRHLWPVWNILAHSSRPAIHFSLALNYALGGLNPWGYHAANIAIHIGAALLLYGVVRRTFLATPLRQRWGEAAAWIAGMVAAIWWCIRCRPKA